MDDAGWDVDGDGMMAAGGWWWWDKTEGTCGGQQSRCRRQVSFVWYQQPATAGQVTGGDGENMEGLPASMLGTAGDWPANEQVAVLVAAKISANLSWLTS